MFCLLGVSISIYAQKARYHVDGSVNSRYDGSLVTLFTFTGNAIRTVDSTYVEGGHFTFDGPEYLYEMSLISLGNYPDTVLSAGLYLERGPIKVELARRSKVDSPLMREYAAFRDSCNKLWSQVYAEEDERVAKAYEEAIYNYRYAFKKKHLHHGLSRNLFIEDQCYPEDSTFFKLYEELPDKEKSRETVRQAYHRMTSFREQLFMKGKPAPDYLLVDSLGIERHLADCIRRGDLVFIDFWASWCGPCVAQEPHLIELYDKYKERGFNIVGVSLDENRRSWLRHLRKSDTPWVNLCIKNEDDSDKLYGLYHLSGLPAGFLVDKTGQIVCVVRGQWVELKSILEAYYETNTENR